MGEIMIEVGFFAQDPNPSWNRQFDDFPIENGVKFNINVVKSENQISFFFDHFDNKFLSRVPYNKRVLIITEPKQIKEYSPKILKNYCYIISPYSIEGSRHQVSNVLTPWLCDVNQLLRLKSKSINKEKLISVFYTDEVTTVAQRRVLGFVNHLKKLAPEIIDFYKSNDPSLLNKLPVLDGYKFHIVLEFTEDENLWTEKIADAFLAETFPFYFGCKNLEEFFDKESFQRIDLDTPLETIKMITEMVASPEFYNSKLSAIRKSRMKVLSEYNIFTTLSRFVNNKKEPLSAIKNKTFVSDRFDILSLKISLVTRQILTRWGGLKHLIVTWINCLAEPKQNLMHKKWLVDNGEKLLRQDLRLKAVSVVIDVGGFTGEWASDIWGLFQPEMFIFEPVPQFFEYIKFRFRNMSKIKCYPYGLSSMDKEVAFDVNSDASKEIVGSSGGLILHDVVYDFKNIGLSDRKIDVMQINIEGGEYELLERMVNANLIKNVRTLLIQFHNFSESDPLSYKKTTALLNRSHTQVWKYEFVWERWDLKND